MIQRLSLSIAIDFRGYGDSDQPKEPQKATFMDLVDDVVALLDTLSITKVFLVGQDFGAVVVNMIAALYPEKLLGMVTLGIPFILPGPNAVQYDVPEGVYGRRWMIKHSHVQIQGLKLHVAEIGSGDKVVLFLHGFPEIWYTWRHQMIAVAKSGFRAIAIDFRGYGDSDQPEEPQKGTFMDLVGDVVALLDTLSTSKVFLVGQDFGAIVVNMIAALYPEKLLGIVTLGVPFMLPGPNAIRYDLMPEGVYVRRWTEPGRAEADFARFDVKTVIRKIYILFSGSTFQAARADQEIMDLVDPATPLPPWFSEEDLAVYASLYEKSGFDFALQVPYRKLGVDCGISDPKVTCPALLVIGEKDYVLTLPGMEHYIRSGQVKHFVPDLDIAYFEEGTHFSAEQLPEKVNDLIIDFLNKQAN